MSSCFNKSLRYTVTTLSFQKHSWDNQTFATSRCQNILKHTASHCVHICSNTMFVPLTAFKMSHICSHSINLHRWILKNLNYSVLCSEFWVLNLEIWISIVEFGTLIALCEWINGFVNIERQIMKLECWIFRSFTTADLDFTVTFICHHFWIVFILPHLTQ